MIKRVGIEIYQSVLVYNKILQIHKFRYGFFERLVI